jgi:hypothetical protein
MFLRVAWSRCGPGESSREALETYATMQIRFYGMLTKVNTVLTLSGTT